MGGTDKVAWNGTGLSLYSVKGAYKEIARHREGGLNQDVKWVWDIAASERIKAWLLGVMEFVLSHLI